MKYLFLLLLLIGCGSKEIDKPPLKQKYINIGLGDYNVNDMNTVNLGNGEIDKLNDNSWVLTSHTNYKCIDNPASRCNKVDFNVVDGYKMESMKYTFDFTLLEYNTVEPPYYIIIWQDWRRRNPLDSNGRHPITTIKVKYDDSGIYLTHCENSWQWGYDFGDDPEDTDHSLHQENDCHGKHYFYVGQTVSIEFFIDTFGASLHTDNKKLSEEKYKTKSNIEDHKIQWGMYWDVNYNNKNDPHKRIAVRIDDFTRYQLMPSGM